MKHLLSTLRGMKLARILVLLGVLFALPSCSENKMIVGGKPRPRMYQFVMSLSPATTELYSKGAGATQLVGRTAACNWPDYILTAPIVAQIKPDWEKIAKLGPDLVLCDRAVYSDEEIAKIKSTLPKADVLVMDVHTVDELETFCEKLGSMMATEIEQNKYSDAMHLEKTKALAGALSPKPKVAVLMPDDTGGYMIAGKGSFTADLMRSAGGEVVGPDDAKFVPLNLEQLLTWAPEVIYVAGDGGKVLTDPRLSSIPAIVNKKVASSNPDLLLRAGARVDIVINRAAVFIKTGR